MTSIAKDTTLLKIIAKILIILLIGLFSGCMPTKLVPDDKFLLNKVSIKCDNKDIDKEELYSYLKQKPNKRILGIIRFHLAAYNFVNTGKKRNWKDKYGQIVGEEPVIYEDFSTQRSIGQLRQYLKNKGYYNAIVTDSIKLKRKRAKLIYQIEANIPYVIDSLKYNIYDKEISKIVLLDSSYTLLKKDELFDVDLLQNERIRINALLKDRGYYYFSKEFIYYEADSSKGNHLVNLTIGLKPYQKELAEGEFLEEDHHKYKIANIYIYCNYDPKKALKEGDAYIQQFDTLLYRDIYFIYYKKNPVKPDVIYNAIHIAKNELYNLSLVEKTYKQLSSLKIYKIINIQFDEAKNDTLNINKELNCTIQLDPFVIQSYTTELEGTNSSGNFGTAGNLIYQHRNLFHGAEILDMRLKGAIQAQTDAKSNSKLEKALPFNTIEFGSEARINIPKFYSPIRAERFLKMYNPKTSIGLSYNYQQRPDYTRTIATMSYGYFWDGKKYQKHFINPLELNVIKLKNIDSTFVNSINNMMIQSSYKDHTISASSYSFVYNNQDIKKHTDFIFFRLNLESAGNILTGVHNLLKSEKNDGSYYIFGQQYGLRYAQYLKSDLDFRFYHALKQGHTTVYRLFAGTGVPYGNLDVLPFEKKYFSGGANSIRAWSVRSLGPGSFVDTLGNYYNQSADIKLEANLEYRFKVIWVIEGALFVDAGNVWDIYPNKARAGAQFKINEFYNQIAVGSGVGVRLDFSFFIFRFDFGMKLRNPQKPTGERWVIANQRFNIVDDLFRNINFGIDYPF